MRELSIEEKAKAYDNIIEKANKMHCENCEACQICIEELIPELKESEDEKIRKELLNMFNVNGSWHGIDYKTIHNWLEKQGEQKPTEDEDREYACQSSEHYTRRELMIYNLGIADGKRMIENAIKETEQNPTAWSEEDASLCARIQGILSVCKSHSLLSPDLYKKMCDWLKPLKDRVQPQPKQKWSEDDERKISWIIAMLQNSTMRDAVLSMTNDECIDWLKFLKDRVGCEVNCTTTKEWKPSDEQMKALTFACIKNTGIDKSSIKALYDLKEQLKKLKEE